MFEKWKEKRAAKKQQKVAVVAPQKSSVTEDILILAKYAGKDGIIVTEVRSKMENHHGSVSGALSNLHKSGKLARLAEKRDRCKIYVLPEFVDGRETEKQGRK